MIFFDPKRNCIYKKIELTKTQSDLLSLLCSGGTTTYEEILKNTEINSISALRMEIHRLRDKTDLNITTRSGIGLVLEDNVFIDY
jgi:DNA-binding response OmpR family regulator